MSSVISPNPTLMAFDASIDASDKFDDDDEEEDDSLEEFVVVAADVDF